MPRAAGSGRYYQVAVLDQGKRPVGVPIDLPSVTTILDAMKKGGLDWWGHKIGVTGVIDLLVQGKLDPEQLGEMPLELAAEQVYEQLKADAVHTPAAALSGAGSRGSNVHDIAEQLLKTGTLPKPDAVPQHQHGYIKGMAAWWQEKWFDKVVHTELPVFSLTHKYAGTLDGLVTIDPKVAVIPGTPRHAVIDFKTNKKGEVYDSHLLQVTAYGHACLEMGLVSELPIGVVIAFGEAGNHKQVLSGCELDDFLKVKDVWHYMERAKDMLKQNILSNNAGKVPAKQKGDADG